MAAVVLSVTALLAACAPAVRSPAPSSGLPTSNAPASHTSPVGATAPTDSAAWAIADRLTGSTYTLDTTAAMVTGLARSGIGTYADPKSAQPDQALTGAASPLRLLDFQTHALAVGAWAKSGLTGTELDAVVPPPAGLIGLPTTSELLAAYVAAADSPGGALSRALLAGQNLLAPARLRFPAIVLVLFASDLATDGSRLAAPTSGPSAAGAQTGPRLIGLAAAGTGAAGAEIRLTAAGGLCSDAANWINGAIGGLFRALQVATPANLPGAIVTSMWNWLVSAGEAFVRGLISSVTDVVLGTIRSIAGTIAAVAEQVASLLPYEVKVTAASDAGGTTFMLGPDLLPGTFTAAVTAGDLPDWPPILADCAAVAQVALADFHAKNVPLTWGPLEAPADPLLAPTGSAHADDRTDAAGRASWDFLTSRDPGDPGGDQRSQLDMMPVAVHRPEIAAARAHLTDALLGFIPGLLRPFVASAFAPYVNALQARLNALLDARGVGTAVLVFHAPLPPTPAPPAPASPTVSGDCNPSPVAPGRYTGTYTYSLTLPSNVLQADGSGPAMLTVAPDGTVAGTFGATIHEDAPGLKVDSYTIAHASIGGTACDPIASGGTVSVVSCVLVTGDDCRATMTGVGPPGPVHLGLPVAGAAGSITWTWHANEPSEQATIRIAVGRP